MTRLIDSLHGLDTASPRVAVASDSGIEPSDSTAISDIGADGKDEHYDCIPSLPGWHRARSMPTPSDLQPPPRHPTLRWIDPPRILRTVCKKRPALNRSRFGPKTKGTSKSFKVLKNIHHYCQLTTKEKREEALMLDPLIHESHDRIVILALAVFNAGGVTASRLDLSRFVTIKVKLSLSSRGESSCHAAIRHLERGTSFIAFFFIRERRLLDKADRPKGKDVVDKGKETLSVGLYVSQRTDNA
ncbi:hypothetical protein V6N11_080515 [Hibiscus sabdariffa]|uniref:Uncharacterized protein n=1 Tax=Hibiscus sabdariffa TaxID=183260 RepID=A0ABR2R7Y1_9ROSI